MSLNLCLKQFRPTETSGRQPWSRLSSLSATVCLALLAAVPSAGQSLAEADRFTIGFEQRVRSDNWNNVLDMSDHADDQRDQLRDRTRLWVSIPLGSAVSFVVGVAAENTQRIGTARRFDEVFFEQACFHWRRVFVKGLEIQLGRFDIAKGEGFVIFDGTPGDGPRSGYFNGVDLAYSRGKSKIDLIAAIDPARDRLLPRIHDQRRLLQSWDEQVAGAYFTNSSSARTPIEAYYFYKKEVHDVRAPSHPQFQPDRHVSTIGGRVTRRLSPRTDWVGEYARQWGAQHGGSGIGGWGGYSYVKHVFDRARRPYVKLGYWAMSGDDPQTRNRVEGWDPLFSQWPKWSDMYPYTQGREAGTGYWTNLHMSQAEAGFSPIPKTTLSFIWYHMESFHPFPGSAASFGQGTSRGENFQTRFEFAPNAAWKAYVHYETHHPGDFYAVNRAAAYAVQAQVTCRFAFHPFQNRTR